MSPVCIASMKYTVHNDSVACDLKEGSPIASSHPVFRGEIRKTLHVASQVFLEEPQPLDHPFAIMPPD